MVDAPEPDAGDAADRAPRSASATGRSRARKLDRRAVAICVCIALVAAIAAGLVASIVLSDDDDGATGTSGGFELAAPSDITSDRLLAVRLETPEGKATSLDAYRDEKPMLVNIWASSCLPCIEEMPMLEAAKDENAGIAFVGVATQDRLPQARKLAEQTGITYPWVQDLKGDFFYEAKASGMPTTLLLDADGTVVATKAGAFEDAAELQSFIDKAG